MDKFHTFSIKGEEWWHLSFVQYSLFIMLNSLGIVLYSLSIVLNILYLFWICNAAYNIECILTTSLSNRPKKHRNVKRKKRKLVCKITKKLSCIRTTEKGWKKSLQAFAEAISSSWNVLYLWLSLQTTIPFSEPQVSPQCFLPMINYPV